MAAASANLYTNHSSSSATMVAYYNELMSDKTNVTNSSQFASASTVTQPYGNVPYFTVTTSPVAPFQSNSQSVYMGPNYPVPVSGPSLYQQYIAPAAAAVGSGLTELGQLTMSPFVPSFGSGSGGAGAPLSSLSQKGSTLPLQDLQRTLLYQLQQSTGQSGTATGQGTQQPTSTAASQTPLSPTQRMQDIEQQFINNIYWNQLYKTNPSLAQLLGFTNTANANIVSPVYDFVNAVLKINSQNPWANFAPPNYVVNAYKNTLSKARKR